MPAILPANQAILELLHLCSGQWHYGFSGPVCLNLQAITMVADKMGLLVDENFYWKLRAYEQGALQALRGKK